MIMMQQSDSKQWSTLHRFNKLLLQPMRKTRLASLRTTSNPKSPHIAEDSLNRKSQFLQKYQTDISGLISKINTKPSMTIRNGQEMYSSERKSLQKSRSYSIHKGTIGHEANPSIANINDYQKMILGLDYGLESQRKRREALESRNASLQAEISNLRNLLVGPTEEKYYERTLLRELQEKISILQSKLSEQKKHFDFMVESKGQQLANKQMIVKSLQKKIENDLKDTSSRKILELLAINEEMQNALARKNIALQKMIFHGVNQCSSDEEDEARELSKLNKQQFYLNQLQIANKLIFKKNVQILNLSNKIEKNEELIGVIEQYLDKKQVKNIDLNLLESPCIIKLKKLLKEKIVFEKQLLGQLNEHSKIITTFQEQLKEKTIISQTKITQARNENKRIAALVISLENKLERASQELQTQKRVSQVLRSEKEENKKLFVEEIMKLKSQLGTISSVAKNQFDRIKLQNFKLAEQNKSLLFLVGEKQKELHKKGESIKIFEQYKDKINNLHVDLSQRKKIESVGQENHQIGTKLALVSTFSQWMMEWNKIKNWSNKKILLNIILDKEEIQTDSLNSINHLINVLHESFLSSKNVQIQQRAIVLLGCYLKHSILKNINLFIDKISPIIIRGFRQIFQGEDSQRHRILNQSALIIVSRMYLNDLKWQAEMTNEMLSINGLKYLFQIITTSKIDELVECSYNCLTFIVRENEMISFMNSFNVTVVVLSNLNSQYPFLAYALHLLKTLLSSRDYLKSQKSLLQFRKIYTLIKDCEDQEELDLILDCTLILMQNTLYVKSTNKMETISILSQAIRQNQQYNLLKKMGEVYAILLSELQNQNTAKMLKEADQMIQIISSKKFNQHRFNRAVRIILKIAEIITESDDLDQKLIRGVVPLYDSYGDIEGKTKVKLNQIVNTIFERNKETVNKFSNENWIASLVQAYKQNSHTEELIFLLKILQFQHQQKRTTQILRNGRQSLISKHINDSLASDYNLALLSLKNLLSISKEKYSEKFINKALFTKIVNKVLTSRNQEEYLGTIISILYFFCKSQQASLIIIELGLVVKIFTLISQNHDKEGLIYKCLTLLELCHSTHYKKKILNYLLSSDSNLQVLKTLSYILKKAKNKQEMGTRVVFIYDFLNSKATYQSLAILIEQNTWMVQDLIDLRNNYVSKVDPLVYKIQMLLHSMSTVNTTVRKIYEKFKVQGQYESEDDQ